MFYQEIIMSINITSDDVKVIDINGYYIRIIPSRNLISENIIQALGIHWTTWDGLAGIQWIYIDGVCYNFHSFDQLIQMCKIKDVAIPAMLHKYIYPFTIKKHDDLKEINIMNNISTTIKTMSSLEIAELTGKQHKDVMRDIRNMITQLEKVKLTGADLRWYCESSTYTDKKGELRQCYLLDYNTTVNLLTGYDAAKRMMVIQRWQELENKVAPALPNFADPAEAAIAWANQYKEKERIQLELKEIETQIAEDKPYTKLGKIMTMVEATIKIGEYAIMLQNEHKIKIGQNRLFEWLRERGYLCKEDKYKNRPTQKSMELGLFAWTERVITTNHGEEVISFTPRITGKGQAYFIDKLIKDFSPKAA